MQRNFDHKEENRQSSDVDVHLDVATVQHFSRHDLETLCTLVEREQRELIKTVAIDRSRLSVRGSCLLRLARRRTGISSVTFASLCQSREFNRNAKCPTRLTIKLSTPVLVLSVFSPISTTARAGVRKSRPINKGRCSEGTTLKTIFPFLPATATGSLTLIEETSEGMMHFLVSDTLTRIQRCRFSAVVSVHRIHGAR